MFFYNFHLFVSFLYCIILLHDLAISLIFFIHEFFINILDIFANFSHIYLVSFAKFEAVYIQCFKLLELQVLMDNFFIIFVQCFKSLFQFSNLHLIISTNFSEFLIQTLLVSFCFVCVLNKINIFFFNLFNYLNYLLGIFKRDIDVLIFLISSYKKIVFLYFFYIIIFSYFDSYSKLFNKSSVYL